MCNNSYQVITFRLQNTKHISYQYNTVSIIVVFPFFLPNIISTQYTQYPF